MKTEPAKTKDFKFKQFHICGGLSGMPVSTDGVLLGAWASFSDPEKILDIGTGTGLLALMCAQRFAKAEITALDIDDNAIAAASTNFNNSHWTDRLQLILQDVLEFEPSYKFDAIICNPPYFNTGEQSSVSQRAKARHTDTLNHKSLLARCHRLLTKEGRACFILPLFEGETFLSMASEANWNVAKVCRVRPNENKPTSRLLIELSKQTIATEETELSIRSQDGYSEKFTALTKAFYLKM
ncbi:methyltransferase [Vibrio sp. JC009]|uniref:tRNA1(Val) (adenine(37)-N6)-methyltransferase n=1 Tax=Vibrio sp. JC009 TaxID=2912314 RepID=UPI0023AFDB3D|nr:methyltransferase [Vibrio sp. JC009]WED23315.1 methyltransferase [Vibrio sp. JC009]